VIAYFTTQAFKSINAEQVYLDNFWEKSVDCALLIKFLGCSLDVPNAERLFILGLLHNLGELVVKQISSEKVLECQSKENSLLPWSMQRGVLGFTYGECGAELLKLWQLPYNLVAPIRNQDEEDFSSVNTETQLLYIAKRIMTQQTFSKLNNQQQLIDELQLTSLGVSDEMLRTAIDYCDL